MGVCMSKRSKIIRKNELQIKLPEKQRKLGLNFEYLKPKIRKLIFMKKDQNVPILDLNSSLLYERRLMNNLTHTGENNSKIDSLVN